MKKIAIIHPQLIEGGGSESTPLWIIEALIRDYDVYLITMGEVDLNKLNNCYGANLKSNQFKIISNNMDFSKVENKIYIANNILPMIARIKNEIERREEIRRFAERMSLPEESLLSELNKIKKGNKIKVKKEAFFLDDKEKKEPLIEIDLLNILLTEPVYIQRVKKKICVDDFTGEVTSRLIKYVFESEEEDREVSFHQVMDYFGDERINQIITRMILSEARMRGNKSEILGKLLENMCRCKITKKRNKLEKEITAKVNKTTSGIISA